MRSEHKNLSDHYSSLVCSGWANVQEQAIEKGGISRAIWGTAVCKQDKEHRVRFSLQERRVSFLGNANEWHGVMLTRKGLSFVFTWTGARYWKFSSKRRERKGGASMGAGLQGKLDESHCSIELWRKRMPSDGGSLHP